MMPLLFRDRANPIREIEGRFEIRKSELFLDVVIVDNLPVLDLGSQRLDLLARQGRHSPSARNTGLLRKSGHGNPPSKNLSSKSPKTSRADSPASRFRAGSPRGDRQHEFPTVSPGGGDGVKIGAVDKVEFQRSCTVYPPHDAEEENRIGDRRKSGTDEQHLKDGLAILKKMPG